MIAIYICIPVVALLFLWLFLIAPGCSCGMEEFKSLKYAHRGLHGNVTGEGFAAENSMTAFRRAIEAGYGIEFDVQVTKDGVAVVFHDATLTRICGVTGKVKDMTYAELREFSLSGTEDKIPTLREVLELVSGKVPLLIELKGEDTSTELCKLIAPILDKYKGAYSVESFNPFLLRWFKKNRKSVARGQLVTKINAKKDKKNPILSFVLSGMLTNVFSRPDFIAVNGNIRNKPMVHICESIMQARVFVWTVKNEKEYVNCRREQRRTIFEDFEPKKIERNR
jgi:glycerophosphoryl diester phosphodiesterase